MIFHRLYCHRCHKGSIEKIMIAKCRYCGRILKAKYFKGKPMKVYIAASYPRIEEATKLGEELEIMGYEVLSYWHQGVERDPSYHSGQRAIRDMFAVQQCDLFIELIGDTDSRGGRHCELGLAIAWEKKIILIGTIDDCIFTHLPWIPTMKSVEDLLKKLKD